MSGKFEFTEDAMSFYSTWCHLADANPPFYSPKFDGYCGRRRNHLLSLAMVCSASRSNEMIITKDDLERSSIMLAEVEVKMGTVFRGIGTSEISALINDAIVFIENSSTPDIPLWQFARQFEGNMDKMVLDRVLFTLETAKYIRIERKPSADTMIRILDR